MSRASLGITYGLCAYVLWGLFPVYFHAVSSVPALELLAQRVVWSFVFVGGLIAWRIGWQWVPGVVRSPRTLAVFTASAAMVFVNWGVYIFAVSHGRIVDATLGYFMNPLVNVLLGAVFLHERLRSLQWIAVSFAAGGVLWLTGYAGTVPWIGLALAAAFGLYGLLRKIASLGAFEGLLLETALMIPAACAYLAWIDHRGESVFWGASAGLQLLVLASGPVTAMPLLFFAASARRIPLSTLGLIQYLGPSIQLVLALSFYGESLPAAKLWGYVAIWTALVLYSAEGLWQNRRSSA